MTVSAPLATASGMAVALDSNLFGRPAPTGKSGGGLDQGDVAEFLMFAESRGWPLFIVPEVRAEGEKGFRVFGPISEEIEQIVAEFGVSQYLASDWEEDRLPDPICNLAGEVVKRTGDLIILGQAGSVLQESSHEAVIFLTSDMGFKAILSVMVVGGTKRLFAVSPTEAKTSSQTAEQAFGDVVTLVDD